MIQTSFFPQPKKDEPIKIIQINPSGLQPRKVEEIFPNKKIVADTYMIYPTGGYHPFYGVPNTFPRYQLPIWPYVRRIKFSEKFKGDKKMIERVRSTGLRENTTSSQVNPFIRADYFSVGLAKSTKKTHNEQMHRLVAKAWVPNPENKPFVMHINDDSTNFLPENLKWGTQGDNLKGKKFRVPDGMIKRYLNLVSKGIIKG